MKLVQCVPNFSEGRDQAKVESLVNAIKEVQGVVMLDVEKDADHHRSVITFAGDPEAVLEAAFRGAKKAVETIDLRSHQGEHPRMGAVDVIPFTPLFGVSMDECIAMSKKLGERLARELGLPVYLYALSAQRPERENLANVRKGEFEGLSQALGKDASRDPDFGPTKIHPSAGAVAVGAREHIINFNVNLNSRDMEMAKAIAKTIRTSGGGLPYLRAKEIDLAAQEMVQISTVLTNYPVTGIEAVYEAIEDQAGRVGVVLSGAELIGMVPSRALEDFAVSRLGVKNFNPQTQVLENRLIELLIKQAQNQNKVSWVSSLESFCDALAKPEPVPGGGSASAAMGAMGLSLVLKTLLIQQRKNAKVSANGHGRQVDQLAAMIPGWRQEFLMLAQEDSLSYQKVVEAYRIAKTDPKRDEAIQAALKYACEVPLKGLHLGLQCINALMPAREAISSGLMSDFKVGLAALSTCCRGAEANVLINLEFIKDEPYHHRVASETQALISRLSEF